jgi:hypothetical protein
MFAGNVGESSADGVLGKIADVFDAGTVVEPLLVGALAPLRQVLFSDETVLEKPFHVTSHRSVGVEPNEDFFRGHVIHDPMVELFTDPERETGYLAFTGCHVFWCWCVVGLNWVG